MATTITSKITRLNTNVVEASEPSQLQQSGVVLSFGGTTLTSQSSGIVMRGGYPTLFIGQQSLLTPGVSGSILSSAGNYIELANMAASFFGVGSAVGFYVMEMGSALTAVAEQIAAWDTWLAANPKVFYSLLTPAEWDVGPPPAAATLTSTSGGTLTATTYYVRISYLNASSVESQLSSEVSLNVAADYLLTVDSPAAQTGMTTYNVYVGTVAGSETLQNTTPINIGTNWTEPTTGLISGTAAPVTQGDLVKAAPSPNSQFYYFVTASKANSGGYPYKSAFVFSDSPDMQANANDAAVAFYSWLSNNPAPNNFLAGMGYRQMPGATALPDENDPDVQSILTNYANLILTGAQAGLPTTEFLFKGTLGDGSQASAWYGIDWVAIQMQQAINADILNGSNRQPPLLYDQKGVEELAAVAQAVENDAISFKCCLQATVSYTPFATYIATNQGQLDYGAGAYNGLSVEITAQQQFLTVTVDLTAQF